MIDGIVKACQKWYTVASKLQNKMPKIKLPGLVKNKLFWLIIAGLALIVLANLVLVKRHYHVTNPSPTPANASTIKTKPDLNLNKPTLSDKGQTKKGNPATPKSTQTISSADLIRPYGTLVSNHYPSLSGKPAPSTEESECLTNPGVTCYIQFTKDGVTKRLPPQTTNSSGVTSWRWDVKANGFMVGNWKIEAVATSGPNSKTRQDDLYLMVTK